MLTGNSQDLSEDTKSFVDDLTDYQIINISKRYFRDGTGNMTLTNKHGDVMTEVIPSGMRRIRSYCQYLIEIGAVKGAKVEEPSVSNTSGSPTS